MLTYLISLLFLSFPSDTVIEINLSDIAKAESFHELTHVNESCDVLSFNLIVMPKQSSGTIVEVINRGAKLNAKSLQQLKNAKVGDSIYLDNVESVADCLQYQGKGNKNFVLKIAAE